MTQKMKTSTLCVQAGWKPKNGDPRVLPIIQSTTFKYDNTEEMADLFDLKRKAISTRVCKTPPMTLLPPRLQPSKAALVPC